MAVTDLAVELPVMTVETITELVVVHQALGDLHQAGSLGHHQLDQARADQAQNPDSPCRARPSSAARVAER